MKPCLAYDFEVNGVYYTISSIEDKTVVVDKGATPYSGNIRIPSTVIFKDKEMKVVELCDNSFSGSDIISVEIAEGIPKIGNYCFKNCKSLNSVSLANSIENIGVEAFSGCDNLTEIIMPSSLRNLGRSAFSQCKNLQNIVFSPLLEKLNESMFYGCNKLNYLKIPKTIKSIGANVVEKIDILEFEEGEDSLFCERGHRDESTSFGNSANDFGAFSKCSIKKIVMGRNLSYSTEPYNATYYFKDYPQPPFYKCSSIRSIVIKDNVNIIPPFDYSDIDTIVCESSTPIEISQNTFTHKTYVDGALYVPLGSKSLYEEAAYWKNFFTIVEKQGENEESKKCEKPTITYKNGILMFYSATEGAVCHSRITDADITSYNANEVQLGVTYIITVYAAKSGYDNSETATATLCWIDVEPKTEGIDNGIAQVRANAVMIKAEGSFLTIEGADDNTDISVYTLDGALAGSAISKNGVALVNTNITSNSCAIVKIGNKSVKVFMK